MTVSSQCLEQADRRLETFLRPKRTHHLHHIVNLQEATVNSLQFIGVGDQTSFTNELPFYRAKLVSNLIDHEKKVYVFRSGIVKQY